MENFEPINSPVAKNPREKVCRKELREQAETLSWLCVAGGALAGV